MDFIFDVYIFLWHNNKIKITFFPKGCLGLVVLLLNLF